MTNSLIDLNDSDHGSIKQKISNLFNFCHDQNVSLDCSHCSNGEVAKSACREYVINQLGEILMEITEHFISEEKHMNSIGVASAYKSLMLDHKKEHADIVETVSTIVTKSSEASTSDIIKSLVLVLLSRFEHHENTHDKKLRSVILAS